METAKGEKMLIHVGLSSENAKFAEKEFSNEIIEKLIKDQNYQHSKMLRNYLGGGGAWYFI